MVLPGTCYSSSVSRSSSRFAAQLKALGRFLHRLCGPDENVGLILTQGFIIYQQVSDDPGATDTHQKVDRVIKILDCEYV